MENWKPVFGYEGSYEVSDLGNVRGLDRFNSLGAPRKGGVMSQTLTAKGYRRLGLSRDGKMSALQVHRLVCLAFIPNPDNKPQVNHIDGDKTNNHLDNLEWCTNGENQIHAFANGYNKPRVGELNNKTKLTALEAQYAKWYLEAGATCAEISRWLGVLPACINDIKHGNTWKHLST